MIWNRWRSRPELAAVALAIALALAVRLAYVLATRHLALAGDELEYDAEGSAISHGHLFWTSLPYGIPHAGAWKAPGYPLWVGAWYTLLGHHPLAVRLLQIPFGGVNVWLGWRLAGRLAGGRCALVAAFAIGLYPLAFQYEELLYAESLATPLTLLIALLALTGVPTRRRAVSIGLLGGVLLLIRPGGLPVLLMAVIALLVTAGRRRGLRLGAVIVVVAALVVVPWTVRNAVVEHGFLPIAVDDAAAYGTFNDQSAHDPVYPYAWRPDPPNARAVLHPPHPLTDLELHSRLQSLAFDYIRAHPFSIAEAFFWNGLSRLWDVRHRSHALAEVPFEGRDRSVAGLGLDVYYVVLPLALVGLVRLRRQPQVLVALIALALGSSIVYTADSGTRYRAPIEPLLAITACVGVLGARGGGYPEPAPGTPDGAAP